MCLGRFDRLTEIAEKLERLLNGYLDQVIDEREYRDTKAKLLSEKKSLQEEIATRYSRQNDWLAPLQNWLKEAQNLNKIASDSNPLTKKIQAKKIFGSHLTLGDGRLAVRPINQLEKSGQNQWVALRAAHQKRGKMSTSLILGRLLYEARTHFQNKN